MAKCKMELPVEIMKEIQALSENSEKMMAEMVKAAAEAVYSEVDGNLKKSFKSTKSLRKGLRITKVYHTKSDDAINIKVGFYGYDSDTKSEKNPKGKPIPLIALAREYGTSRGEKKKPFFRKAFSKKKIELAMQKVQDRYIEGE